MKKLYIIYTYEKWEHAHDVFAINDEEEAKRMVALVKSIQQDSLDYIVPFYKKHGNDCFDWDDGACDELWILEERFIETIKEQYKHEELLIKYIDDFSEIFFSENRHVNYRSLDYEIRKG